jgi:hypothetical protein
MLDHRLALADTISTAVYFAQQPPDDNQRDAVREWQQGQAEAMSRTVDPAAAIPYRMPRAAYATAGLLLVASSLFALRYGLSHTLDLRPPLASILHDTLGGDEPVREAAARKKNLPKPPGLQDQLGITLSDQDEKATQLDPVKENALDKPEIPDFDNSKSISIKSGDRKGEEGEPMAGDDEASEDGQAGAGDTAGEGQPGAGQPKDAKSAANQPPSNDNNSLMQKFKEAMQNLLSKVKQQPAGNGQKQSSDMAQNGKQGKQQQGGGKKDGSQGQKQSDGEQADSPDGEPGSDSQTSQNAQTKGTGQSNEQQANKQPGSGIGRQDGDKDVKLAEQMAAMGKISEIIGKRSATVSGEAMVEVQNTNQQLSTRYEGRRSAHGESGAEINRDEVPVALQGYVAEYFEQVRKQAPQKK